MNMSLVDPDNTPLNCSSSEATTRSKFSLTSKVVWTGLDISDLKCKVTVPSRVIDKLSKLKGGIFTVFVVVDQFTHLVILKDVIVS